ncbi:MAG TPA: 2-phosphosulfolactate phosphatase [Gammaproteobacteria bacterium]|jgi:2-phosphosulfolactate phosphatase|nr:2-phosphosulfolactate phosphatase [Gammaproteobacteria bacterium]
MYIKTIQYSMHHSLTETVDQTAVIIDVFRATSVIVTALQNGAEKVIVAEEVAEALAISEAYLLDNYLLGGERESHPIQGFHYGNSPQSYTRERVDKKDIILTTTNGTKAALFCQLAKAAYACALLNCESIAQQLISQQNNIAIICAGSKNSFALEDAFCAGMLISEIEEKVTIKMCDFSIALKKLYHDHKTDMRNLLSQSKAYQSLISKGYEDDVDFCLQKNIYHVIPTLIGNEFTI